LAAQQQSFQFKHSNADQAVLTIAQAALQVGCSVLYGLLTQISPLHSL
jgi:hypothetical protein